jgi:hypothetical protein
MRTSNPLLQEDVAVLKLAATTIVNVFCDFSERLSNLEMVVKAVSEAPVEDKLYTVREAAEYLRMQPDSLRKTRRLGRIKGVSISQKEWGFYQSELDRYLKRYNRPNR